MSVNYDPTMKTYSGQGAFRFWCQKVLPLVYDDSLSYYELLNKVVDYLNNTISDVANMEDNVSALLTAYEQLQDYVNDYFDNLDVQTEINNKLDAMVLDGTFYNLFKDTVDSTTNDAVLAWLDENITGVGNTVLLDRSLTLDSAAAPADLVGDLKSAIGDITELNTDDKSSAVAAINEVNNRFLEPVADAVDAWLDEHPEATTTVENNSITEEKINSTVIPSFLGSIKNYYVTPEMYGAVGDGTADDTQAIKSAINSGSPVLLKNTYKTTSTITITNSCPTIENRGNVNYTGDSYAFKISGCRNKTYNFGFITASSGGGVLLDSTDGYIQYLNINFNNVSASTNCFYINVASNWINEIRFYSGMVSAGTYGFYLNNATQTAKNHIMFICVGFEGATTGIYIKGSWKKINCFACRMEESTTYLIESDFSGDVSDYGLQWYGDMFMSFIPSTCKYPVYIHGFIVGSDGSSASENGVVVSGELYNAFIAKQTYFSPFDNDGNITLPSITGASNTGSYYRIPNVSTGTTRNVYIPKLMVSRYINREIYIECYIAGTGTLNVYSADGNLIKAVTGDKTHRLKVWQLANYGYVVEETPIISITNVT